MLSRHNLLVWNQSSRVYLEMRPGCFLFRSIWYIMKWGYEEVYV